MCKVDGRGTGGGGMVNIGGGRGVGSTYSFWRKIAKNLSKLKGAMCV